MSFVREYDLWARSGYADPIPISLRRAVADEALKALEADQSWYLTNRVKQHGSVEIASTKLIELDGDKATVEVTLDATEVTVTAAGESTWVDYSQPIVTRFDLEKSRAWRIVSTEEG